MIPLILGAIAVVSAVAGVGAGAVGMSDMNDAKEIGKRAQRRHEDAVEKLEDDWQDTNESAEDYGEFQLDIMVNTIGRFINFIERNIGKGKQSEKEFLEGLDGVSIQQIKEYKTAALEAEQFFKGGVKAVGAAAAGYGGAMSLATSVGVASTGAAISGLSGAAATNATLAWLGGGSLAAGGGGMALGSVVLGGITVGPALAIGGFMLASQGEKALTKAREYEAEVNTAIAKIETAQDFMVQVRRRINELRNLLESINNKTIQGLEELESVPSFDKKRDADKFQQVALLVKALAEIMKTPVLDGNGKLNPVTAQISSKYCSLGGN
jgi:hypothetical protein